MTPRPAALVALLAVTGALAGAVPAARSIPPAARPVAGAVWLPVAAGTPALLCPGPQTLVVPPGGTPVPPGGPVTVTAAALTGSDATARLAGSTLTRAAGGTVALGSRRLTAAGTVRLDAGSPGLGRSVPDGALQVTRTASGDLRGLDAVACGTATAEAWLVGGGTAAGERDRLLLANPTPGPAVVDVLVHGVQGPVAVPAGAGVVVAPGRQVAVYVDALAPGVGAIAVHVRARSGRVAATLHHSLLRGVTPGGVDDVSPSASPATRQVLPGVVVAEHGSGRIRILVPGSVEGVVRVRLVGPAGPVAPPLPVASVAAGAVHDVPLVDVPPGVYTAVVEADVPVVAGALSQRTEAGGELAGTASGLGVKVPPGELAWTAATAALRGPAVVALPGTGPVTASLVVAAPGEAGDVEMVEVDAAGRTGRPRVRPVPAGGSLVVPLAPAAAALVIRPAASATGLYAAVLLRADDAAGAMFSVVPVRPGPAPPGPAPQAVEDLAVGLALSR